MSTVLEMKDEWVKTASLFGEVEAVMTDALRRYAIDKCIQKWEGLEEERRQWLARLRALQIKW